VHNLFIGYVLFVLQMCAIYFGRNQQQ